MFARATAVFYKEQAASEQVVVDDGHLANVLVYVKDGLGNRSFGPPQQCGEKTQTAAVGAKEDKSVSFSYRE